MAKQMAKEGAKKPRGFALMSAERRREIARLGGESVKPQQRSFYQDPALAARAGAKGGLSRRKKSSEKNCARAETPE